MNKIKKEELPDILTDEIILILVNMAMEFPKTTFDWAEVSELLKERNQLMLILDKVDEIQRKKEQDRKASLSEEEKEATELTRKKFYKNLDPNGFYGNMGQPETAQEYKNRYGVWPPGYDKDGNKTSI